LGPAYPEIIGHCLLMVDGWWPVTDFFFGAKRITGQKKDWFDAA
jgi:hypothetical protein